MANLVTDSGVWNKWKNTYPHILDVKTAEHDHRGGTTNSNTADDAGNEKKDRQKFELEREDRFIHMYVYTQIYIIFDI